MGTKFQLRRGTTEKVGAFTPDIGEPVYDVDNKILYIGDNSTVGGLPVTGTVLSGFNGSTTKGTAYYIDGSGNVTIIEHTTAAPYDKLIGIGTGKTGEIQITGVMYNITGLAAGRLFVGTSGALQNTPPSGVGEFIIPVGFGRGTTLVIQINNELITEVL